MISRKSITDKTSQKRTKTDNAIVKNKDKKTMNRKTLHRLLKIEQNEPC